MDTALKDRLRFGIINGSKSKVKSKRLLTGT